MCKGSSWFPSMNQKEFYPSKKEKKKKKKSAAKLTQMNCRIQKEASLCGCCPCRYIGGCVQIVANHIYRLLLARTDNEHDL